MNLKKLSGYHLKFIAVISMLIDHIAVIFQASSLKVFTLFYGQPADFPFHSFVFCLLKASFTQRIKKDISSDCLFLLFYLNCLMIWHSDICPLTDQIFSYSFIIHFLSFQQPSNSKMYYLLYF